MSERPPMSTSKFILLWALCEVVGRAGVGALLYPTARFVFGTSSPYGVAGFLAFASGLVISVAQSAILSGDRRPVSGWIPASVVGWIAVGLLNTGAGLQLLSWSGATPGALPAWLPWAQTLVAGSTRGLVLGAAQGLALKGASCGPVWHLWLAGRLAAGVLAGVATRALIGILPDTSAANMVLRMGLYGAVAGLVEGAATAWLLDRCAFRRAPDEAPRT